MSFIQEIRSTWRRRGVRERIPWRKAIWFYLFILPWIIGFLVFTLGPVLSGIVMSFTNFDGVYLDRARFVGLHNYVMAFQDKDAWWGFKRVMYLALVGIPPGMILSFLAALLLTRNIRARGLFRTLFYIPSLLPVVGTVWVWKMMMDNNYGLVNALLDAIKPGTYVRWMTEYPSLVLVLMGIWGATGQGTVYYMAGFQNVPRELEEAALIDGANAWARFRYVTLPLVTPVIFYQLVTTAMGLGQILVQPLLLAGGIGGSGSGLGAMPPRDNYVFMVHVFKKVFDYRLFGYGFALLWLLFAFSLVVTLVVFGSSKYWVYYEVAQD
jgi:multiple sugar transport system permease protein